MRADSGWTARCTASPRGSARSIVTENGFEKSRYVWFWLARMIPPDEGAPEPIRFCRNAIDDLAKHTLYLPNHILTKFGAFTGDESETHDPAKPLKPYSYDWKVVTLNQLDELLAESTEPVYVFDFVKTSSEKQVTVYRTDGLLLFRTHTP